MIRGVALGLGLGLGLVIAGCGAARTVSDCDPACAPGTRCDPLSLACLPDPAADGGAPDLASSGCAPACAGLTPYCNAAKRCVACRADADCPLGTFCKVAGDSAVCASGCNDDKRCSGGKCCGNRCLDTSTDPTNCGGCGSVCSGAHTLPTCAAGKCVPGKCDRGWGDCNGDGKDGCETNLHTDPANCTACGMKCNIANAINACADGCYPAACKWGFDDCNNDPMDGCETAVLMDGANCGKCGMACAKLPNAMAGCMNGSCVLGACSAGYGDCDGDAKNGCEAFLAGDPKNCGACGKNCAPLPGCQNGVCSQNANSCIANPLWMKVSCTTTSWVWSRERARAMSLQAANTAKVLATGCMHGENQPQNGQGLCSLDGKGWISTKTFTMMGCDAAWYHLGGSYTGNCGGHDGDVYRHLALGDNDCYPY